MKTIAIVCAMDKELDTLKNDLNSLQTFKVLEHIVYIGSYYDYKIILAKTGIGKVAAATFLTILIERYHPELVINMGIAGGYDKKLKTLDTVIATGGVYSDVDMLGVEDVNLSYGQLEEKPPYFKVNDEILTKIKIVLEDDVKYGMIATGDQFVTNYENCQNIVAKYHDSYQILAFDMESTAILQVCYEYMMPCIIIRTISDVIGSTSFFDYLTFSNEASLKATSICKKILQNL